MGKAVRFSDGLTRNQMMRQARKCFPGVHGTKKNAPQVADILSMQSMTPAVFKGKLPADAPPRGPMNVRIYKIDSKTKTKSLLKSFLPRLKYGSKFLPYRTKQYQECERAFASQSCLILQMNSLCTSEINKLRSNLFEYAIKLAFVRSSILQNFCATFNHSDLQAICKGPILLAYGNVEPSGFKSALSLIEKTKKLVTISGRIEGKVFIPKECKMMINDLPSKKDSIIDLINTLHFPTKSLERLLNSLLNTLKLCLETRITQLQVVDTSNK